MLTRRARHQAKYTWNIWNIKIGFVIIILLCLSIVIWQHLNISEDVITVTANGSLRQEQYVLPQWRDILFLGVPGLVRATEPKQPVIVKNEQSVQQLVIEAIRFFIGVDIKDIRSILRAEIPMLAKIKSVPQTVSAMTLPNFPKFEMKEIVPSGKPLVGLYYTHTAESFVPNTGATHKPGGQRGDIVDVGEALSKRLGTYGISTLQNTTIHDYPSFMKAYDASEVTVKKMIAENPSIQMLFDIHRDAGKKESHTATVNGVEVAKIKIMVCIGQEGLVQPHWQQNHAFAKLIDAKLNQRYPGLSLGIQMENWRYNQHLHPRALLIEVGCQENSKEEAQRAIEMFGDILAEIINENKVQ
jgi:stage II sporulation protein P